MHDPTLVAQLYQSMHLIRRVEEHISEVYPTDAVKSPVHLSIGQESIAVGVCAALKEKDIISNTYRCHATHMAKLYVNKSGIDQEGLNRMMAELYGKATGCAGGKAGSMHLIEIEAGIMGASAVVGTTIPVAVGYALAMQREAKKTGHQRMVVAMFGDGATEEGVFTESIHFAALHKIPMIFICENNELAIHTSVTQRWPTRNLCERIATYGLRTHKITDGDVFKIREVVSQEIERMRKGEVGPVFMELHTYRWKEHVGPADDHFEDYRDEAVFQKWKDNDQIARLAAMLPADMKEKLDNEVEEAIAIAAAFATESAYPGIKEFYEHVYA